MDDEIGYLSYRMPRDARTWLTAILRDAAIQGWDVDECGRRATGLLADWQKNDGGSPRFGPQHLYALTRARSRVVKDATNFSDAHARYNQKGFTEQAAQMMECSTACFEVQKFLKGLIDTTPARPERA